jgi:methylase of polypeptide subunit release factors
MRGGLPEEHQRRFYCEDESGVCAGEFGWMILGNESGLHIIEASPILNSNHNLGSKKMLVESIARAYETTYSTSERKLSGTHYTPANVIDYIVEKTVRSSEADFRQFKVLDPACGSGLFLLKAFEAICASIRQKQGVVDSSQARAVLENCIYGIDIDVAVIKEAKQNLLLKAKEFDVHTADLDNNFFAGDALELLAEQGPQMGFDFGNGNIQTTIFSDVMSKGGFDCVLGNPPYIRIQNISPTERRNKYINFFQTATGRFDISVLFVELAAHMLKKKGKLGFVVSNKLLSTNGAKQFRQFIIENFTIEEIVDLADTKLFEAAILPMVLILRRGRGLAEQMVFAAATEVKNGFHSGEKVSNIFEALRETELHSTREVEMDSRVFNIRRFVAPQPAKTSSVWTFHSPTETKILNKIKSLSKGTFSDLAEKISVGLKTTADDVYIKPMTKAFVDENRFERELVFPVLESHNVERWSIHWRAAHDNYVLYPHQEINGRLLPINLNQFPQTKKYLHSHREQLASRTYLQESGRRWYEIWVHQSPRDFAKIKIITPDISSTNRFALDQKGYFVNGTCFYIILKDQSAEMNLAMLSLLNSKVMEYFHKTTSGNVLYAKRFRYWTTYLSRYPVPAALMDKSIVQRLANHARKLSAALSKDEAQEWEIENDRLVYKLFELNSSEISEIEMTLQMNRIG